MFGQLPSGLDRNFVLGHYLPSVALLGIATLLAVWAGAVPETVITEFIADRLAVALTVGAIIALLVAATMSALNQAIIAVMKGDFVQEEGDGLLERMGRRLGKLARFDQRKQKHRSEYNRLIEEEAEAWVKLSQLATGDERHEAVRHKRNTTAYRRVRRYPFNPNHIRPTRFGNVVQAFRDYSYTLYWLDPAVAWPRLEMVMSPDSRRLVDGVKAQVDLMLNLIVVWALICAEAVGLLGWMLVAGRMEAGPGLGIGAVGFAGLGLLWLLTVLAVGAADRWGDAVMAAFDTHLPKLREQIDLASGTAARDEWSQLGDLCVDWEYRAREAPDALKKAMAAIIAEREQADDDAPAVDDMAPRILVADGEDFGSIICGTQPLR